MPSGRAAKDGFYKLFKLTSSLSINNMTMFHDSNCMTHFPDVLTIFKKIYALRIKYYENRKTFIEAQLAGE